MKLFMFKRFNSLKLLAFSLVLLAAPVMTFAVGPSTFVTGGTLVTPSEYKVNVTKIEFQKTDDQWVTFFSGSATYDLASVSTNTAAGTCGGGGSLAPGTYKAMRVTFSKSFTITAATADAGSEQPCHTESGNSTTSVEGLTSVAQGTADGDDATSQTVLIPEGSAVDSALPRDVSDPDDGTLQLTTSVSFTVDPSEAIPPSTEVSFDVTNAVELSTTAVGSCVVIVHPPTVRVEIESDIEEEV